jgi:DNA-binding transcriptional MerR regulator
VTLRHVHGGKATESEPERQSENTLRIDQLAQTTGLSVRNIRSHHERGLLPAPEVHARVGYYGPKHIERIRLILSLQNEGLKLDGIKRLLEESHSDSAGLLRVKQAAEAVAETEAPEIMSGAELAERLSLSDEEVSESLARAARLGVLIPLGDGQFQVLTPSLIDAAEEVVRGGMKLESALRLVEDVGEHSDAIARHFVETFVADVWKPFAASGMPEAAWPRIAEAMERTRPVAAMVVLSIFRQKMSDQVEETFAQIAKRLSEGKT